MADSTLDKITATINRYLPPIKGHTSNDMFGGAADWISDNDVFDLNLFMLVLSSPTGYVDAWKRKDEEAKLDEILRTVHKLVHLLESVHETIRESMEDASIDIAEYFTEEEVKSGDRAPDEGAYPSFSEIFEMLNKSEILREMIKVGYGEIELGRPLGRRKWQAVCAVDACREVWHRRTGKKAPTGVNPDSPFGNFVKDIFDDLDLDDDPQSATQSWREVQSRDKNT